MAYRINAGSSGPGGPRKLRRSSRTVVRVIGALVAVYFVFDMYLSVRYFGELSHQDLLAPHPTIGKAQAALMILPLAILVPVFIIATVFGGKASRWWDRSSVLIASGELEQAADILAQASEDMRSQPQVHALVQLAYGDLQLRMNHVGEARECLLALESEGLLREGWYAEWLRGQLGVAAIAAGDLDEARRRVEGLRQPNPWANGVYAARRGLWTQATHILSTADWSREVRDACFDVRAAKVVRALAIRNVDPARGPAAVADVGRAHPDEFRYLAGHWPEMTTFLDEMLTGMGLPPG